MKKGNKLLLLTGLATVTIGTAGILHTNYIKQPEKDFDIIKAYNHQPANILDNVFEQDNTKYLPFIFESATQADNITPKKISKDEVISAFAQKGLTVKNISTGEKISTGTQITIQENSDVYHVVVYGDINGDGTVNVLDIQRIVRHIIYRGTHEITGTNKIAANVQNDNGEIDVRDAQRILRFCIDPVKNKVLLNEPTSLKEADKVAPIITLIGDATIQLEVGDSYTDQSATAFDNYDGDLTTEINQPIIKFIAEGSTNEVGVAQVDTSKVGTYIITYTVADSNGNVGTKSRTVIVKSTYIPPVSVAKIEIASQPTKKEYQYGEATKLDLAGASIIVYTDDGNATTKNITEDMLSAYDLTEAGEKVITVTYGEKTAATTINVTVKNPITGLVLTSEGSSNVQETADSGYQTNSKEEFVLGTIQANAGGSILQPNQLKIEKTVAPTTDNSVTAEDLTITVETDNNGNAVIKGRAEKVGNYTIKAYVQYGETQKVERTITLTVQKSSQVRTIELQPIVSNEILKLNTPIRRKLVVTNVNGEIIEAKGNQVIATSTGATISIHKKLADGTYSNAGDLDTVDSLQISTTLETAQTIQIAVTVNGKTENFPVEVQNKSIFNIEVAEQVVNVYTILPNKDDDNILPGTTTETSNNIYTLITPTFKDQYGADIVPTANDIVDDFSESEVDKAAQEGKIGILLPKVSGTYTIEDEEIPLEDIVGIDCRYYKDKNMVDASNDVNKIGFSIPYNEPAQKVNLTELNGKQIIFKWKDKDGNIQSKAVTIKVNYKELSTLEIDTTGNNLTVNGDGNYEVKVGETFTLGTITIGDGETPVTDEELDTDKGGKTGIDIFYTANTETGKIVVTGVITKEDTYQIKPKLKDGSIVGKRGISIKGIAIPIITNIAIEDFGVKVGGNAVGKDIIVTSNLTAPSTDNKYGQAIRAKDIQVRQTNGDDLDITIKTANGNSDPVNRPDEIVKSIEVKVKAAVTEEKTANLEIVLFEGQEGYTKFTKPITVNIYKAIPRSITVDAEATLYDQQVEGTAEANGLVYTLVPVKLFADTKATVEIDPISTTLFEETAEEPNTVWIVQPKIDNYIDGIETSVGKSPVLDIKYFKENKTITDAEDVKYIGIAMTPTADDLTYHKAELNGKQITLTCVGATGEHSSATITLHYEAPTTE